MANEGVAVTTCTRELKPSLWWSPVEEYASCIEGAGYSRKSLHKQLSATESKRKEVVIFYQSSKATLYST